MALILLEPGTTQNDLYSGYRIIKQEIMEHIDVTAVASTACIVQTKL